MERWRDRVCGPTRDTHFFAGNIAKYQTTFVLLGAFWPPKPKLALRPKPQELALLPNALLQVHDVELAEPRLERFDDHRAMAILVGGLEAEQAGWRVLGGVSFAELDERWVRAIVEMRAIEALAFGCRRPDR